MIGHTRHHSALKNGNQDVCWGWGGRVIGDRAKEWTGVGFLKLLNTML